MRNLIRFMIVVAILGLVGYITETVAALVLPACLVLLLVLKAAAWYTKPWDQRDRWLPILLLGLGILTLQACGDSSVQLQEELNHQRSLWHWKLISVFVGIAGVILGVVLGTKSEPHQPR